MANQTLADLQRQWYAEDTGTSGAGTDATPLTSLFPQIGSLFNRTKVDSVSNTAVSGSVPFGGFPFSASQAFYSVPPTQNNDKALILIAGALIAVVFAAVILKAAR